MELIAQINGAVNSFVWGAPMLILLIGVGILMTVRNKGLQFRKFGYAMKNTIGKIFKRTHAGEGEITPFQAVSTGVGRYGWHRKHRRNHHGGYLGRTGYTVLAVGDSPDWYGHQVFRGASGGEVPGAEQVRRLGRRPHVLH